jgi:hypothetical protein
MFDAIERSVPGLNMTLWQGSCEGRGRKPPYDHIDLGAEVELLFAYISVPLFVST